MLHPTMENVDIVELYEHTLDDVYRYASRLTGGDRTRTDELVQETSLTVLRRIGSARPPADITISYLENDARFDESDAIVSVSVISANPWKTPSNLEPGIWAATICRSMGWWSDSAPRRAPADDGNGRRPSGVSPGGVT